MIIIPIKVIALKSELLNVLAGLGRTSFTVDELTQAYLKHPLSRHNSKKAARQFVYRNMQRLMRSGHMERLKAEGRWPQYGLTAVFFSVINTSIASALSSPEPLSESELPYQKIDLRVGLKDRLTRHQAEVLTAMGEMEEYEAICIEMPDLREVAQPRYNESRERCSRLLGRVKALESLLATEAN